MRTIILAITILLLSYVIKVDILNGTISKAAFTKVEQACENPAEYEIIPVQTIEGDTIFSLFALHPSTVWVSLPERLSAFYVENPHLQLQTFHTGEIVNLPIYVDAENSCP
ncbi:MAG: hypothetical protein ACE3JQ_08105 [Paenisporosarcina sp.]